MNTGIKNDPIFFATRVRGFFKHLFNAEGLKAKINYESTAIYELNSWKDKLKNSIGRSSFFDLLGIVQVIKPTKLCYDIYGSFNRFLNIDKPYFIYVENPTALFHYRLNRKKSFFGKKKIEKELNNPYLKALVFMSNACGNTFEKVCGKPHKDCIQEVIYPYVPQNPYISPYKIKIKSQEENLDLLFVAQGLRFYSKGGLEVIEAFNQLKLKGLKLSLRIITSFKDLDFNTFEFLRAQKDIIVEDFRFSFDEMQEIYANSHILIQPSSDDSSPLTILEAIKSGLPIIGSKLYAIPEMVEEGFNGFLCDPHWWFFDRNNIPNPEVWNYRKKTIYSGKVSSEVIEFLKEKIEFLYNNREVLEDFSLNSLRKSKEPPFACEYIIGHWNEVFKSIKILNVNL